MKFGTLMAFIAILALGVPPIYSIQAETRASMAASAPTSSLFQLWERQGNSWKQRPDQNRCAPGKRKGLVGARWSPVPSSPSTPRDVKSGIFQAASRS